MTIRTDQRRAAVGLLLAAASAVVVTGCNVTDPFASSALDGKVIALDMPVVNGSRPFLTTQVRVAGGPSIPVLVDTGSPGLRVFGNRVGKAGLTAEGEPETVTYEDGTTFTGSRANAQVSIGDFPTAGPIAIQLVEQVSCATESPGCAGADGLPKFARQQGFAGILGIGLMKAPVYSPLVQLEGGPARSFGIQVSPTQTSATLAFNVSPTAPLAVYPLPTPQGGQLANGVPAWDSNSANACWSFGTAAPACAPTSFDTGSPRALVSNQVPGAPNDGAAPAGTTLTLFTAAGSDPVWSLSAGTTPGRDQIVVGPINGGNAVNSGLPLFTSRLVTFDIVRGQVLLANPG